VTVRRTKEGALTERVARALLGAPSGWDSEKGQVRFGDIAVNVATGRYFDYEDETGGTYIELIQRFKNVQNGQAEAWLKENVTDAKPLPLPAEYGTERALIGMLAMRPDLMAAIEEDVTVDNFGEPIHKQLFGAIAEASQQSDPLTPKTLIDAAGGDHLMPVFDGYTLGRYVATLCADAPSAPDAAHLARTLAAQVRSDANREGDVHDDYDLEPEPFEPTMGLLMWADRNRPGKRRYEFIIDDLIPERQLVVIMGDTGTGKSFLTTAMVMSLCRPVPFFGRRVARQLGVIWCAYEAAEGADSRMRAYARHHGLGDEPLPFGALQHPLPLWPNEPNGDILIKEILGIQRTHFNGVPLGAIVVDTYNAATPGASEIDSETVSRIRSYFRRAVDETGATLIIVGHTNSAGKHRGNEQLTNNVDTIIKVSFKTRAVDREVIQLKDDDGREIRTMKVVKQREGRGGAEFDFVLHAIPDGTKNQYGDDRTSCVVVPFGGSGDAHQRPAAVKGPRLTYDRTVILNALRTAIDEHGEPPPGVLKLPRSIVRVVKAGRWKEIYLQKAPDGSTAPDNTINKRLRDASNQFQTMGLIARVNPFVWIVPGKAVNEDPLAAAGDQPEFPETSSS
jgi:hypothetical protein